MDGIVDSMGEFEQTRDIMKDAEAWHFVVHGVTKSWVLLSD